MSVPLPPPEGELTTTSIPRPLITSARVAPPACSLSSLDILHLLAQFFDRPLDGEARVFDQQIGRLRKHRVRLAVQLLQEEVEALARLALARERLAELHEVTLQTRYLFGDVAAVGEVGDFLCQPPLVQFDHLALARHQ